MTREEQIIAKAGDLSDFATNNGAPARYANGYYEGFQEGAKWADEHPRKGLVDIEKVCEYLDKYLINDSYNREPVIKFVNGECFKETFISNLRKAMEE